MTKRYVDLCAAGWKGPGLIVKCESGVIFSNQTGGYNCMHPDQEGIFIPLDNSIQCSELLSHFFDGPKWQGHCYDGIDEETAKYVDDVLAKMPETRFLRVDRGLLKESHEAWIHVSIGDVPDERPDVIFSAEDKAWTGNPQMAKDQLRIYAAQGLKVGSESFVVYGFSGMKGVLTWENSD